MIDKRLENQNVQMKKNFSHTNTKGKGKVWDTGYFTVWPKEANFVKGLGQNLAVPIYQWIVTAGFCPNPVKYFRLLRGCLCARTCWLLGVIELKIFFYDVRMLFYYLSF